MLTDLLDQLVTGRIKMTFLENAQAVLSEADFNKLQFLNKKSADFEATPDEEKELVDLKGKVRSAIAERDKVKNLEFLKSGAYTLAEVLKVFLGSDKAEADFRKAINKAVAEIYPTESKGAVHIADYGTEQLIMFGGVGARNDKVKELAEKGGIKGLVKALHPHGLEWIKTTVVPEKGPYKGKKTYPNVQAVATRFKWKADELKKELKLS